MTAATVEARLLDILKVRSFQRGTFQLASGGTSNYYIDCRTSVVSSEAAPLIGEAIYARTKDLGLDAIGGLETGAIPLATAAVIAYHQHGRPMEGFWVRDKAKGHGTRKLVEGKLTAGMRVAVVDDVFTAGTSAMKAVAQVREAGCQVALVLALVDRLQGARELFEREGIAYQAVFTIRDFGIDLG
jgi:orotate phosphoribosyltransferase